MELMRNNLKAACGMFCIVFLTCNALNSETPFMVEICDNGIDDDADGLIDLNDDDCSCNDGLYETVDLIPNPGFELTDGCCSVNLGSLDDNCMEDWAIVHPSPDLYSPNCLSVEEIEDFEEDKGFDLESAVLRAYYSEANSSEVFGVCFNTPLEVDYLYNMNFEALINVAHNQYVNMALYGVRSCAQLASVDSEMPCLDSNVSELAIGVDFTSFPVNEWQSKTFTFVADYPYEAFFIALSCSEKTFPSTEAELFMIILKWRKA